MLNNGKKSFSTSGDITKVPDEELANLHLQGWKDRYSIQANVEMSRRLKNQIEKFNKQSSTYSKVLIWFTIIMTIAVLSEIYFTLQK